MLKILNLSCYRNDACLFEDLNFELSRGRLLHVQGNNGAGKTTLLRAVSGLTAPTAGKILWDGSDIREIREEYNSNIIYLGHQPPVKNDLSVKENLEFSLRSKGIEFTGEKTNLVLAFSGLDRHKNISARFLSQGQRYKLALSTLFFAEQPLWILDEPFGNLDAAASEALENQINRHLNNAGLVIITSHAPLKINQSQTSVVNLSEMK